VRRPEVLVDTAVETLRPETVFATLPVKPLGARRHVETELAAGENRSGAPPHQLAAFVLGVGGDQLFEPLPILA
jgi:hypothetical protein